MHGGTCLYKPTQVMSVMSDSKRSKLKILVGLLPAALVLDSWARLGSYGGRCLHKPTLAMSGR